MTIEQTLTKAAAALASGETTAKTLTQIAIERMDDPAGEGARTFIRRNDARALRLAEASDAIRAAGHPRSPIEGMPISVKDLFDLKGETTLAGSVALKSAAPAIADAPIVSRLIAAGAVITGTTNMSEFAFSGLGLNPHYDTPRNPFDRQNGRIPGGSSSGAAISVTDGMAMAAIGTDTGGSIRIPPALCGLTGFKPTAPRVSRDGAVPLSTTLDSIGPIARSVTCCGILDAILSGGNPHDLPDALPIRGLRLAIPQAVVLSDMDADVAAAFEATVSRLSAAGAVITDLALDEFAEVAGIYARGTIVAAEAYHWHQSLIESAGDSYDQRVRMRILTGKEQSATGYMRLIAARADWIRRVNGKIAGFDALIIPTVPLVAPEIAPLVADDAQFFAANGLMLRNPSLINFLDGCALSIPCHAPGTAPVGLMVAGSAFADRHILSAGLAIEQVLVQA
ncbi:amidase [Rhizobium halophytocola]|uniref:Aspartyl-tRNA(Asn)/glutamyl-tRNA(Gln) amidotransferase subunit A n=1 Tax=Rhizobium halophytocola TaxID=735519 RepID=A0ABS4E4V7_9HYPH|nr:amidase [Rhizobium halophytocola]MBP1852970.1 aspartyl-tRNA(Asn)/glutamyl-tRNA(Gln) amidotransferase subunit A [Rhizobium halophytocola]